MHIEIKLTAHTGYCRCSLAKGAGHCLQNYREEEDGGIGVPRLDAICFFVRWVECVREKQIGWSRL